MDSNSERGYHVKLVHCGNSNIANPADRQQKNVFYMPMGLVAMADRLRRGGFSAEVVHLDLELGQRIEDIFDFQHLDVVGFDCHWINQALGVIDTARLLKKHRPDLFIVLGGFSASYFAREILQRYPWIDAVVRGDGELPLEALCRLLREHAASRTAGSMSAELAAALAGVPNLVWRQDATEIAVNPFSYVAKDADLEALDFAALDLLRGHALYRDLSRFWTTFKPFQSHPLFLLEIGRGCTHNCSFCGGNSRAQEVLNNRRGYAVRSTDAALATIEKAASFGYRMFYTCFEFDDSDEWYIELFRKLKGRGIDIAFGFGCWKLPSRALVDAISESCRDVILEISPESGNAEVRRRNKDRRIAYANDELEACLDYVARRPNVFVQLYFGHFLPFDTSETVYETMTYIVALHLKYSRFVESIYSNLSTDPCSLLFFEPEKYQVDVSVHNFADYVAKLDELFIKKSRAVPEPDMTLFRPLELTGEQCAELSGKAFLFKNLMKSYKSSVQMLSEAVGSPAAIPDYLRGLDLDALTKSLTTPEAFKNVFKVLLIGAWKRYGLRSGEILRCIEGDYRKAISARAGGAT